MNNVFIEHRNVLLEDRQAEGRGNERGKRREEMYLSIAVRLKCDDRKKVISFLIRYQTKESHEKWKEREGEGGFMNKGTVKLFIKIKCLYLYYIFRAVGK